MAFEKTNNKTILKNTLLLYVRMGFSMLVSLYTTRVILQVLGLTDMGIQATVGSVVWFASFLTSSLSNGTSRFLTFTLGKGDLEEMKATFSTTFWVHLALALVVMFIAETVGLWFFYNKLVIPEERMGAAAWCFHLSVASMIVGMTQTPYGASIIAHEKMNVYAYSGMIEIVLQLLILYVVQISDYDKLILYSTLFFCISIGMRLFYRWYCSKYFEECRIQFHFDKKIFKPIAEYSGWQLFANIAMSLNGSGITILLNMFFSPAVVAARSISLRLNNMASKFMVHFRTASNPQIVKLYAAGNFEESKKLLFQSTKLCYYLVLVTSLPVYLLAEEILKIWLTEVPEYSVVFLKLVIIQGLFCIFDTGFYTAIFAKGRIKENALTSPTVGMLVFPIVYLLFKWGFSPVALSWAFIIFYAYLGLIQKPFILVKVVGYKWSDFPPVFITCLKTTIAASVIPFIVRHYISNYTTNIWITIIVVGTVSVMSVCLFVWYIGIESDMREKIKVMIINKIKKH